MEKEEIKKNAKRDIYNIPRQAIQAAINEGQWLNFYKTTGEFYGFTYG